MSFVLDASFIDTLPQNKTLQETYLQDEASVIQSLLRQLNPYSEHAEDIFRQACELVTSIRQNSDEISALDAFMLEYDLSSEEGVLLMCIAEALLRIPDNTTAEKLIKDKLSQADWYTHLGHSKSLLVNASTWGLMLTGRVVNLGKETTGNTLSRFQNLIKRSGEPMIKMAMQQAMRIMGQQFVMERTIGAAIKRSRKKSLNSQLCSFDMLGEAALTDHDALEYLRSYLEAIAALAKHRSHIKDIHQRSTISVKLSALHPRYEYTQPEVLIKELLPRFKTLALAAKKAGIGLTMDAEEADRLEVSLMLFVKLLHDADLDGWNGLGLAVQAFQKRAMPVLKWLAQEARLTGRNIPVRLVKGAYWDTEIKLSQELGYKDYPVFTRKVNTDVSYLACSLYLLDHREVFYPQFATHNAHTVMAVLKMASNKVGFEFQRLHGMGGQLYQHVKRLQGEINCRVYAPVGSHEDLLPYLVRRLLENGANSSFVNRLVDEHQPVESVVQDPVAEVCELDQFANPGIPLPPHIFMSKRLNSAGINISCFARQKELSERLQYVELTQSDIGLLSSVEEGSTDVFPIVCPQDRRQYLGQWREVDAACIEEVIATAKKSQFEWDATEVETRALCLEKTADLIEQRSPLFIRLCVEEAGKTIADSISEIREAVDFYRYYAQQARLNLSQTVSLEGPTGESNKLSTHGRGVFVCISPWNFPLAIFSGQVAAALVSGNAVIAKPAEQTNLIAWHAVQCLYEAGVPRQVLHLVPGRGKTVGNQLCTATDITGVAFTGSNITARLINQALANKQGPMATLIAETGGQNAMIVDSSALPEQVVKDVLSSAFGSSGQRCSALRVLFIQEEIADRVLELLKGAMDNLVIGDPGKLKTDVGPVIDKTALDNLTEHIDWLKQNARLIASCTLPGTTKHGTFLAPHAFEIEHMSQISQEHFGPILHVIQYASSDLNYVIEQINNSGYGLTLGVHSRIEQTWYEIQSKVRVGNCYINRNITGAVVGVQPFGGEGLSGTGPKAGGPHYLYRFITERTMTINTTAIGGNASLLGGGLQ